MADNYQSQNPRQFLYLNTKAYQDSTIKTAMDPIIFLLGLSHHLETEHREQLGQGSIALLQALRIAEDPCLYDACFTGAEYIQ